MTFDHAIELSRQHGLEREFLTAYRFFKPWWAWWIPEPVAATRALADLDLIEPADER